MHDLSTIKFINSPKQSRKILAAARKFNSGKGHAKSGEKGFTVANSPAAWITDEEWEAQQRRAGRRGLRARGTQLLADELAAREARRVKRALRAQARRALKSIPNPAWVDAEPVSYLI